MGMSIFTTRYSKLNFSYDKGKVAKEILQHQLIDIPPIKQYLNFRPFDLVDKSLYDQVTVLTTRGIEHGILPSWQGYSFTHVPGDQMSRYGGNLSRLEHEKWEWKSDANCEYIKEIVDRLGFINIQNVRAMLLSPPGFGPVHNDVPPKTSYYDKHISITLNVADGGMPLVAMIDGSLKEYNDDCFIFQDNCWHGVGQVSSQRIQLRINGTVDEDKLNEILSRD
jgi:hypothetical protein